MTACKQIDFFLDQQSGGSLPSLPPWAAAHVEGCPQCRRLFELLQSRPARTPDWELAPLLQSRIERRVLDTLKPVAPLAPAGKLALGFLAIFAALAAAGIAWGGAGGLRLMSWTQFAGVGALLAAGTTALAASLSRQMVPAGYHKAGAALLVFVVAAGLLIAWMSLFPWRTEGTFLSRGLRCATFGLLLAAPSAACFVMLVRRGTLLSPALTGAATGLLAGLVGAAVLHFGCINLTAPHLAVWHAGIPITSALTGFLVGKRLSHSDPGRGASGKVLD
ncbi:MAG: DUF1109 family protein [Acidobacteria bacterium]|nr:DUF1109 family protein [Acidobacteriota bacterium]